MAEAAEEKKFTYGQQPSVTRGGDFLYVTQRCGRHDPETGKKNVTIQEQTVGVIRKMERFLAEHGATLNDIVHVTVVLAHPEDNGGMNDAYFSVFKDHQPARTLIVAPLHMPDMLLQMGCVAYSPLKK